VSGNQSAAVWLLLSRHTVRKDQGKDDFLTVHIFKQRGGHRVYYLEQCWQQGVYSNRPHCLVQFDLPPGNHKLTLALAQYKPVAHQVDYTLKVYSMAPFTLRKLPFTMRETKRLNSAWRGASAGGCANFDTVVDNPRVLVTLEQPADVQIELSGPEKYAIGLELSPLADTERRDKPLATSGTYRIGFCLLEARGVPAGKYVLTPATFGPTEEGDFSVLIGSSAPVSAGLLHPEGHQLHKLVEKGEWSAAAGTAAGSPNHGRFHRNPQYRLHLSRTSDVLLRLRAGSGAGGKLNAARPHLGLGLYARNEPLGADEARGGGKPRHSAGDGVYSSPPGGALIPRTSLDAGTYVLVLSTFDPHNGPYELIVYAASGAARLERCV